MDPSDMSQMSSPKFVLSRGNQSRCWKFIAPVEAQMFCALPTEIYCIWARTDEHLIGYVEMDSKKTHLSMIRLIPSATWSIRGNEDRVKIQERVMSLDGYQSRGTFHGVLPPLYHCNVQAAVAALKEHGMRYVQLHYPREYNHYGRLLRQTADVSMDE